MFWPSTRSAAVVAFGLPRPATRFPFASSVRKRPRLIAIRETNSATLSPYWTDKVLKGWEAPCGAFIIVRLMPCGCSTALRRLLERAAVVVARLDDHARADEVDRPGLSGDDELVTPGVVAAGPRRAPAGEGLLRAERDGHGIARLQLQADVASAVVALGRRELEGGDAVAKLAAHHHALPGGDALVVGVDRRDEVRVRGGHAASPLDAREARPPFGSGLDKERPAARSRARLVNAGLLGDPGSRRKPPSLCRIGRSGLEARLGHGRPGAELHLHRPLAAMGRAPDVARRDRAGGCRAGACWSRDDLRPILPSARPVARRFNGWLRDPPEQAAVSGPCTALIVGRVALAPALPGVVRACEWTPCEPLYCSAIVHADDRAASLSLDVGLEHAGVVEVRAHRPECRRRRSGSPIAARTGRGTSRPACRASACRRARRPRDATRARTRSRRRRPWRATRTARSATWRLRSWPRPNDAWSPVRSPRRPAGSARSRTRPSAGSRRAHRGSLTRRSGYGRVSGTAPPTGPARRSSRDCGGRARCRART